jgi:sugar-specific transcriptional regulator TrmB
MGTLSEERVIKALKGLGLSSVDVQVYIYLARTGPQKMTEIALALDLSENKIDRSLQELQSIRIVKASIENPLEFVAVPFEEVIDLFIEVKKEQAKTLQENREELLSNWRETIKKKSQIVSSENS